MIIENRSDAAKKLQKDELCHLVELLDEKDDKIRYQALLLLKSRSLYSNDMYPYWNVFREKLKSENSYLRSIGLMLIAENTKWDNENKMDDTIDDYLMLLKDEKPITIRQCIQSLSSIIPHKSHLNAKIASNLMSLDILSIKETMRRLVLTDILNILVKIRKYDSIEEIESYIENALSGGILDKNTKKQIELML